MGAPLFAPPKPVGPQYGGATPPAEKGGGKEEKEDEIAAVVPELEVALPLRLRLPPTGGKGKFPPPLPLLPAPFPVGPPPGEGAGDLIKGVEAPDVYKRALIGLSLKLQSRIAWRASLASLSVANTTDLKICIHGLKNMDKFKKKQM